MRFANPAAAALLLVIVGAPTAFAECGAPAASNPFPRTFYRASPDLEHATIIYLAAGQRVLDADIQLPAPLPSRTVTIAIDWNGHRPDDYLAPIVAAFADGDVAPRARLNADGTYTIGVLPGHVYRVSVQVVCRAGVGLLKSDAVPVDGGDASRTAITVALPAAGVCRPRTSAPPI